MKVRYTTMQTPNVLRERDLQQANTCFTYRRYIGMSPRTYALALSAVALLLKFEGGDAFAQPGAVSIWSRSSNVIMSKTIMSVHDVRAVERRTFVTTLISGGLVGASGLGLAMERAEAYEVCHRQYLCFRGTRAVSVVTCYDIDRTLVQLCSK